MKLLWQVISLPVAFALAAAFARHSDSTPEPVAIPDAAGTEESRVHFESSASPGDPMAILQTMEERFRGPNPPPPRRSYYSGKAMDNLIREGGPFRIENLVNYTDGWARDDPEAMFAWLMEKDGARAHEAHMLFARWAEGDMEAALAGALQLPDSTLRAQALLTALEVLAKTDRARARRILLENSGLYASGKASFSWSYSEDPDSTWKLLEELPPGPGRTAIEADYIFTYGGEGRVRLWNQATDPQRREWFEAARRMPFAPYSFAGLPEMMRSRVESSGNADAADDFMRRNGENWAREDLAAASQWAMAHCKGTAKKWHLEEIYRTAMDEDAAKTIRVWKQLPEGYLKRDLSKAMLAVIPEERRHEIEQTLKSEQSHP